MFQEFGLYGKILNYFRTLKILTTIVFSGQLTGRYNKISNNPIYFSFFSKFFNFFFSYVPLRSQTSPYCALLQNLWSEQLQV